MGRFIVADSNVRAPYWPVSPNSFGSQIGASPNGDAPGDIYRLLGGVVLRRAGQAPMYAGYIASAFLLPKGTNNNRIVAAGSEDLNGPLGDKARFFLVGLRPGTAYDIGSTFRPAMQIDPILPASVHFVLTYPDGRQVTCDGTGDKFGSFAGPTAWPLDVPGVYRYQVSARWSGYEGRMPGLPDSGGWFFVYSKTRPAGAAGLRIDGASQRTFSASTGVTITGTSGASSVRYTLITPGAVIDQGEIPVRAGRFTYTFDPVAAHAKVPLYDIVSVTTGKPQIGRVIHLTFFAEEKVGGGSFFDVSRVILRGTTAITARGTIPIATATAVGAAAAAALASTELGTRKRGDAPVTLNATSAGHGATGAGQGSSLALSDLRAVDAEVDRLLRQGDLVLLSRQSDSRLDSRTHERLQQLYQGIPVIGGQVTRQLEDGLTRSVSATLFQGVAADTIPQVSAEAARATVEQAAGIRLSPLTVPRLVLLPTSEAYALAWRVEPPANGNRHRVFFVGAADGTLLEEYIGAPRHPLAHALADFAGAVESAAVREIAVEFGAGNAQAGETGRARTEFRQAMSRALSSLLPAGAGLGLARTACLQSAVELFGAGSAAEREVEEYWRHRQ